MKRNAFGQLGYGFAPTYHRPFLRYFAPDAGEGQGGTGGGDGGNGDGGQGGGEGGNGDRTFTQEEVDRIVADRLARANRPKPGEQPKPKDDPKSGEEKPSGVSETDIDQRIQDALTAERKELALERVADQLDKALEGRTYAASKLFALDRSQFISEDGKSVNSEKLKTWVKENTEEGAAPSRRLRAQGERDGSSAGGSVQAGRDMYDEAHTKKSSRKD